MMCMSLWEGNWWISTLLCCHTLDFVEGPVKMCLDSGRARVTTRCYRCGEPRTDSPAPWKEPPAAPSNVPPTVSEKEPRIVPPRDPPGALVGPFSSARNGNAPSEDMIKALKVLHSVMSAEDFSKYEKMVLPPPKKEEREDFLRRCRSRMVRKNRSKCTWNIQKA